MNTTTERANGEGRPDTIALPYNPRFTMHHLPQVLVLSALLIGLLGGTLCHGQSRDRRSAPNARSASPSTEMRTRRSSAPSAARPAPAPGIDLSSYAEPSAPSPRGVGEGSSSSWGTPSTQNGPDLPSDPSEAPIGGLEWLVAAAAGYGAYRLREQSDADA